MSVQSKAWQRVGKRFEALGSRVRADVDALGEEAGVERASLQKSVHAALSALEEVLSAAGKTVRDPVLRKDLAKLAASVRDAALATFESVGSGTRARLAGRVQAASGTSVVREPANGRKTAKSEGKGKRRV